MEVNLITFRLDHIDQILLYCQESIVIYECSHLYKPEMIDGALGDIYVHLNRVIDPSTQGQPVARKRCWGVLFNKSFLAEWSGGMSLRGGIPMTRMDMMFSRLLQLFERRCEISFHHCMISPEDEIIQDCNWMRSRRTSTARDLPESTEELYKTQGGLAFLTHGEKSNLECYRNLMLKKYGKSAVDRTAYQLNQNAREWPMHSKSDNGREIMHTLIKNVGILFVGRRGMTTNEMALFLGYSRWLLICYQLSTWQTTQYRNNM